MSFKSTRRISGRALVYVCILTLGAGTGVAVASLSGAAGPRNAVSAVTFPTNQNGQTYGSASKVGLQNEPDLIYAVATNGKKGYIYRSQLWAADGTNVNSPSAAQQYMQQETSTTIPVYDENGTTVIGEFVIPAPSSPEVHTNPSQNS